MPALPDRADAPAAATAATDPQHAEADRHLHPVPDADVPDTETTVEFVPIDNTDGATMPAPADRWDHLTAAAAWLRKVATPDSGLYTERQPSIAETVRRAKHGSHLPESGPLRTAAMSYSYAYSVLYAVAQTALWIARHPARLAVASALLGIALLALF